MSKGSGANRTDARVSKPPSQPFQCIRRQQGISIRHADATVEFLLFQLFNRLPNSLSFTQPLFHREESELIERLGMRLNPRIDFAYRFIGGSRINDEKRTPYVLLGEVVEFFFDDESFIPYRE